MLMTELFGTVEEMKEVPAKATNVSPLNGALITVFVCGRHKCADSSMFSRDERNKVIHFASEVNIIHSATTIELNYFLKDLFCSAIFLLCSTS